MFHKFQFLNGLPNRYFPENCRWVPLKALCRKWHYPLNSMHLKCKDWRRFNRKQRLKKCPNGQVMAIFGRSPKSRIFRKSAKGRPREVFQKSPKKQPSLQWAKSSLAQMSLSSKLYPLIMQRLKKIWAQKAAPKLPKWPSYGNFCKVTQDSHFLKKCKGCSREIFQNSPKTQPSIERPKRTLTQITLSLFQYALNVQGLERSLTQKADPKVPEQQSYSNSRKVTPKPAFSEKVQRGHQKKFFKNRSLKRPKSTLEQIALSSNQYALIVQRLQKLWRKRRLKKCSNGQVIEILPRSPETLII